jgi:hypothetical protein
MSHQQLAVLHMNRVFVDINTSWKWHVWPYTRRLDLMRKTACIARARAAEALVNRSNMRTGPSSWCYKLTEMRIFELEGQRRLAHRADFLL